MVKGIEHTGIAAKDSKALTDWYVKVFGTKIVYDNGKGVYFIAFESGDMIEIFPAQIEGGEFEEKTSGLRHIALSVDKDDFDAMVAVLKADDGAEEIHDVSENEKGVKMYWFRDIEGNFLHLMYRPIPLV